MNPLMEMLTLNNISSNSREQYDRQEDKSSYNNLRKNVNNINKQQNSSVNEKITINTTIMKCNHKR